MKRALISVSDKTGLVDFAKDLVGLGYEIVSTGGTAKALADATLPVIGISEVTGFPEILEGRVKTLHPNVHGGILAKNTPEHFAVLAEHQIAPIDLVVVNLYPFQATIAKEGVALEDAIENIDIGGPTMVRSAAKNYERVAIVVNPMRYESVLAEMTVADGSLSLQTKKQLALEAFQHTAQYDAAISNYLAKAFNGPLFSGETAFGGEKIQDLRYGENPHQKAAFYRSGLSVSGTVANAKQLNGKELSYNNIVDVDAAWQIVTEFTTQAAAVIVKHTNPCGTAIGQTLAEAYSRALAADPVSAYGGIIALNQVVDQETASLIINTFMEAVIAPSFSDEALEVLRAKKNLRLLAVGPKMPTDEVWIEKVSGGFLVQELDSHQMDAQALKVVTEKAPTQEEIQELLFAWHVVKHVKSNAIVVTKDGQTLGVGAGQMNRVGSAKIAFEQAGEKTQGAVLASDAFFPFRDSIDAAYAAGIRAIVQPGGSIRDEEVIAACNEYGMIMVFTGIRHFKH